MPTTPSVLLLDFDHTLYPVTVPTLKAVDDRITLYIQTFLGFPYEEADRTRLRFCEEYGTTLRGLELNHGVERTHYYDFIHAVEAAQLPPPDPALHDWLSKVPHPCYLFTNARMDWAVRGLRAMGLEGMLPVDGMGVWADAGAGEDFTMLAPLGEPAQSAIARSTGAREEDEAAPNPWKGPRLHGILDIEFMDWMGKPHESAYAKADRMLRERHGQGVRIHFADDRPDNLMAAKAAGWQTLWITPDPDKAGPFRDSFDRVARALTALDPENLALLP